MRVLAETTEVLRSEARAAQERWRQSRTPSARSGFGCKGSDGGSGRGCRGDAAAAQVEQDVAVASAIEQTRVEARWRGKRGCDGCGSHQGRHVQRTCGYGRHRT